MRIVVLVIATILIIQLGICGKHLVNTNRSLKHIEKMLSSFFEDFEIEVISPSNHHNHQHEFIINEEYKQNGQV